jgi:hypothetical protein
MNDSKATGKHRYRLPVASTLKREKYHFKNKFYIQYEYDKHIY